jgi:hypothetical protein
MSNIWSFKAHYGVVADDLDSDNFPNFDGCCGRRVIERAKHWSDFGSIITQ